MHSIAIDHVIGDSIALNCSVTVLVHAYMSLITIIERQVKAKFGHEEFRNYAA